MTADKSIQHQQSRAAAEALRRLDSEVGSHQLETLDDAFLPKGYLLSDLLHPVYDLQGTLQNVFLTVDGRLGTILEFETVDELLFAYTELFEKYDFLHLQAQDYFGRYLLSISKYLHRPTSYAQVIFGASRTLRPFSGLEEALRVLDKVTNFPNAKLITEYPEFPTTGGYHLLKQKYRILWPPAKTKTTFALTAGFCVFRVPFEDRSAVMYYTRLPLKLFLLKQILCVEFVDPFRVLALYFWLPLGTSHYLSKIFKLF